MRLSFLLVILLTGLAFAQAEADPVILELGERRVALSEFDARFRIFATGLAAERGLVLEDLSDPQLEPLKSIFLNRLATEFVLQREAARRGLALSDEAFEEQFEQLRADFPSDEDFFAQLEQSGFGDEQLFRTLFREALLLERIVEALEGDIELRDYQLRLYYDRHLEDYSIPERACAKHILVASRQEALEIAAELESGARFEALAAERSQDPGSATNQGDIGCFARGMTVPTFEEAAFSGPLGRVSTPVETQFGFHLVLPYRRLEAQARPFDEVEDELRENLRLEILRQLVEGYVEGANIELYPERLGVGTD